MDQIEELLEGGKAAAAAEKAANGDRAMSTDEGKSERKRTASPTRSHTSSRSHRRSRRDRSRTPRGDKGGRSRSRESRRSSRRHRDDERDDDKKSSHSSSSKRDREKDVDTAPSEDGKHEDRKRRRRSGSRERSERSSRRNDRDGDRGDQDRDRRRDSDRQRDREDRDRRRRDSPRDSGRRDGRDEYRGAGRRRREDSRDRLPARDSPKEAARGRSPSPPRMSEEEHEMRSVFVSQLSARVGDRELFQFCESQVGKVRDARVILDRVSRRSKGVAYVEFFELDDVRKAINLTGTKLLGIPIIVQYTEAERNRQAGMATPSNVPEHITVPPGSDARGDTPVPWNRIYVGSLPFSLRENDIRQIFEPFGPIDVVDLHFDNITQKSKGYCFVQYRKLVDAQQALDKMNGFEIAGRPIRCGLVTEKGGSNPNQPPSATGGGGMMSGGGGGGGPQRNGGGMMRPDSLEEGSGGLNNISRIELMQKLARTESTTTAMGAPTMPMFRVNVPTATSKSVLLKNMFNPAEETERDWDIELRDDVKGECEAKYGKVVDIRVVKDSAGEIYVKFDSVDSGSKAVQGLNGRWFGGSQVSAQFISDAMFDAHRK